MLIDTFLFHNEYDILEGRLEYLNDVVSFFVISEMDIMFSGKTKELNFPKQISRYRKYLDKIIYLPYSPDTTNLDFSVKPEKMDFSTAHWIVENGQRNHLMKGLRFFGPDDFVMISDVDEIPIKSAIRACIQNLNSERIALAFEQEMFYYNFKQKQVNNWHGSVITTNQKVFENMPQWFRDKRWSLPKITKGGYHLSYWNTPEMIREKVVNFAHQELNNEEYTNIDNIVSRIKNHEDLFDREENPFMKVESSSIDKEIYEIFKKYEKEIT
jgi:beta-1,4-mannosyl-glycoprotein beta-1,4-N-acetylglucosaminyltransferase